VSSASPETPRTGCPAATSAPRRGADRHPRGSRPSAHAGEASGGQVRPDRLGGGDPLAADGLRGVIERHGAGRATELSPGSVRAPGCRSSGTDPSGRASSRRCGLPADVEAHLGPPGPQRRRHRGVGRAEGIIGSDIEPQRRPPEGAPAGQREEVVSARSRRRPRRRPARCPRPAPRALRSRHRPRRSVPVRAWPGPARRSLPSRARRWPHAGGRLRADAGSRGSRHQGPSCPNGHRHGRANRRPRRRQQRRCPARPGPAGPAPRTSPS